jgi:hypothetical protein
MRPLLPLRRSRVPSPVKKSVHLTNPVCNGQQARTSGNPHVAGRRPLSRPGAPDLRPASPTSRQPLSVFGRPDIGHGSVMGACSCSTPTCGSVLGRREPAGAGQRREPAGHGPAWSGSACVSGSASRPCWPSWRGRRHQTRWPTGFDPAASGIDFKDDYNGRVNRPRDSWRQGTLRGPEDERRHHRPGSL